MIRAIAALAVCLIAGCAYRGLPEPATVCAILAEPDVYSGKLLTIRALVESDGRHLTLLTDASCSDAGIALVFQKDAWDSEGAIAVRKALASQRFGTPPARIEATFTGVLTLHPGKVPARVFLARAISNVDQGS